MDYKLDLLEENTNYQILNETYGYSSFNTDFNILSGSMQTGNEAMYYIKGKQGNPTLMGSTVSSLVAFRNGETVRAGIRPVIHLTDYQYDEFAKIADADQTVLFGVFPQQISSYNDTLNDLWKQGSTRIRFVEDFYRNYGADYIFDDKHFVRKNISPYDNKVTISSKTYKNGDSVWFELEPVAWLLDKETKTLISKSVLTTALYLVSDEELAFEETSVYKELQGNIKQVLFSDNIKMLANNNPKEIKPNANPYGFIFDNVTEEDIVKGMIDSNVSVFLHGRSSEGKSARVKQIDPTCEIIYLRNATPDSLNGKSVYDQETDEMIDVKPTWLKNVEEKCSKEPDKNHIVFFDEITNALPSIQGIAFNIILDKEVNGKWKLPENARIVAAGNEMADSLAANKLAEPLFNRFAHVYIETNTNTWLKWAVENNIHPAIILFIEEKNGSALRTAFNGVLPNADPRKWEMASKILYETNNPEMLRSLIGEELTKEFIEFCVSYKKEEKTETEEVKKQEPQFTELVGLKDLPSDINLLNVLNDYIMPRFVDIKLPNKGNFERMIRYNEIITEISEVLDHHFSLTSSAIGVLIANIKACLTSSDESEFKKNRARLANYNYPDCDFKKFCLSVVDIYEAVFTERGRLNPVIYKIARTRKRRI